MDDERQRRQARDDAFMAQLRAEHRHELRVTLGGGGAGLVLTLIATAIVFCVWGATVPLEVGIGLGVSGIAAGLGCIFMAHVIDDRRRQ